MNKIFMLFLFSFVYTEKPLFEGVSAVVENNVILKSDVSQISTMTALQQGIDINKNPEIMSQIKIKTLESLIDQKVVLEMAKIDSIFVSEKEVNSAIENQIDNIIKQAGSKSLAEEYIGQSIKSFKKEFWKEMEERLITEQYQYFLLNKISINKEDVLSFYEEYKDSLGTLPTLYNLNHIQLSVLPSKNSYSEAFSKINKIRKKIINGENFDSLAVKYSEDPGSSKKGGLLGFVERGSLVPNFETVAFTQETNKISDPVLTEFGYHIIETLEKKGDKASIRHILIKPIITQKDEKKTIQLAKTIKDSIFNYDTFKSFSKKYSSDEKTKNIGGKLGWVDLSNFYIPEFEDAIKSLEKINSCSFPIKTSFGYHLIWISEIKPGGKPNLQYHWSDIESFALNYKKSIWFKDWLNFSKESVYIKIFD